MKQKPKVLPSKNSTYGIQFICDFTFNNQQKDDKQKNDKQDSHTVPVFDVSTTSALNQIIGHAKFVNSSYGNVYYRGINGLYDNVIPSAIRQNSKKTQDKNRFTRTPGLDQLIVKMCGDIKLGNSIKVFKNNSDSNNRFNKYRAEELLQHYTGKTRMIDVVDNHWVAMWMGLQNFVMLGERNNSCICQKRMISLGDELEAMSLKRISILDSIYEYILLIAMPYGENAESGIVETEELIEVDLRRALPSTFLRPHAQHALVIGKRDKDPKSKKNKSFFDMASQVVAILRIRNDRASKWLGEGDLLCSENFFPSPTLDIGYRILLNRTDLFEPNFSIVKYF